MSDASLRNADFERLKALMDEQVRRGEPRRLRLGEGLGIGVAAAAALFAVTPLMENAGALVPFFGAAEARARVVEPKPQDRLPVEAPELDAERAEAQEPDAEMRRSSESPPADDSLPTSVARAAAVVLSNGRQVGRGGHYDVRLTAQARRALRSVGVKAPPESASAAAREAALIRGLGRLVEELGSLEAALTCLRVERKLVEAALDLAWGSSLPNPDKLESFARYLPPAARRSAEGPTQHIMALSIGYEMQWPVPEVARVSSGFGPRVHPVLGDDSWHSGTDLVVDEGTPIVAMADGYVVYAKRDFVNGKFVKLDHGYGLTSAYVHNSKNLVVKGEHVRKGQVIALSGQTGRATGPHLHFQVEIDDRAVDPEGFRERKAPRAHHKSIEAEAIGDADVPK